MMFRKFLALTFLVFIPSLVEAANYCSCYPNAESKKYIGPARQKQLFGFIVHWTCEYYCMAYVRDGKEIQVLAEDMITAEYRERYFGDEDGREGICEGMVYVPKMNYTLMRTIYMYEGKNEHFSPAKSKSKDLKTWAQKNNCQKNLFFDRF